jgi:hypothetical protein
MPGPWDDYKQKAPADSSDGPWAEYQAKPPKPTPLEKAKEAFESTVIDQLPALGAAGGGLVGGVLGAAAGGVGAVPGALGGAGVGGYSGKALQNMYNQQMRPELAPKTTAQVFAEPIQAGAEGVAYEGIGMGVGNTLVKGAGVVGRNLPTAEQVAQALRKRAALKATRAVGRATPTVSTKMAATGEDVALGEFLLDNNAIPVVGTPGRIGKRVDKLAEKAGQDIGEIVERVENARAEVTPVTIRDADAGYAPYTPVKLKKYPKGKVVQEEVLVTPVRFDENPAKRLGVNLRSTDAPPTVVRGETQAIQKELRLPPGTVVEPQGITQLGKARPYRKEVVAGPASTVPVRGTTIKADEIADGIRKSKDLQSLKKNSLVPGEAEKVEAVLDQLASKGELTIKEAQELRQYVDSKISFSKKVPDMAEMQQYLYDIRTGIRDRMNLAADAAGTEAGALKNANRRYHLATTAQDIGEREMGRTQSNHSISLMDLAAANLGEGSLSKAAIAVANKAARSFGNATQARALNAASKGVRATEAIPVAAKALAGRTGNAIQADVDAVAHSRKVQQLMQGPPQEFLKSAEEKKDAPKPGSVAEGERRQDLPKGAANLGLSAAQAAEISRTLRGRELLLAAKNHRPGSPGLERIKAQLQKGIGAR